MREPSTSPEQPAQPVTFDPVTAGREIDALHDRMHAAFKRSDELTEQIPAAHEKIGAAQVELREILEGQRAADREGHDARNELISRLVAAKASVANFKAFVETHTHISLATAKRMLAEAAGKGEQVREQSRRNTAAHRARQKALTNDVRATDDAEPDSKIVKLDDYRSDPVTDDQLHTAAQDQANKTGREVAVVREDTIFKVAPDAGATEPEVGDAGDDDEWTDDRPVKSRAEIEAILDPILALDTRDDSGELAFQIGPDADRDLYNKIERAEHILNDLASAVRFNDANGSIVHHQLTAEANAVEHARRSAGAKRGAETRRCKDAERRRNAQVRSILNNALDGEQE